MCRAGCNGSGEKTLSLSWPYAASCTPTAPLSARRGGSRHASSDDRHRVSCRKVAVFRRRMLLARLPGPRDWPASNAAWWATKIKETRSVIDHVRALARARLAGRAVLGARGPRARRNYDREVRSPAGVPARIKSVTIHSICACSPMIAAPPGVQDHRPVRRMRRADGRDSRHGSVPVCCCRRTRPLRGRDVRDELRRRSCLAGDMAEWLKAGSHEADVVIGGPPCQGFSALGTRIHAIRGTRCGGATSTPCSACARWRL